MQFKLLISVSVVVLASACQSTSEFESAYSEGNFVAAETALNESIAAMAEIEVSAIQANSGRTPGVIVEDSDLGRLYMEKAMMRLAQGDAATAVAYLRDARESFDEAYLDTFAEYLGNPESLLLGDSAAPWHGADYEHIMLRFMLTLTDLLTDQQDFRAYAFQIGEKQREILGSSFGEEAGYEPRKAYEKVALGAYMEGVVREGELNADEALRAYQRAASYMPSSAVIADGVVRTTNGSFAPMEEGVVHVFYLGGRGPTLSEGPIDPYTEIVLALVKAAVVILQSNGDFSPFFQDAVPIPIVTVNDATVPSLVITQSATGQTTSTSLMLDVNKVAQQQLEANQPMILMRAVLRRGLKAAGIGQVDEGELSVLTEALSFGSTVLETADLRNWSTLPAEIQMGRMTLPAGTHELSFGEGMTASVNVKAQSDTYVLVVQPILTRPGSIIVDRHSIEFYKIDSMN